MRKLVRAFWVVLAVAFLIEAWLWDHLKPLVARVVDLVPWDRLKARLAAQIEILSPIATLAVFIVPLIVLFPVKTNSTLSSKVLRTVSRSPAPNASYAFLAISTF